MPWSGGSVVVASEVQVIGNLGKIFVVVDAAGRPTMYFYNPDSTHYGYINLPKVGADYGLGVNGVDRIATNVPGTPVIRDRIYFAPNQTQIGPVIDANGDLIGGNIQLFDDHATMACFVGPSPTTAPNKIIVNASNVLVDKPIIVNGEAWITPTLTAPFTGAVGAPVQYRLKPDGDVQLRGGALYGVAPAVGGYPMFTLPVGYRPTIQDEYPIARQGAYGAGKIVIDTVGLVSYFVNDGAANPQLGGVRFSTL